MKIFHLSDLHIGLRLVNRDLSEDQNYIFEQIAEMASKEKPDAVVIAGDIYDKAIPSAEAVELFDRFVVKLREAVPDAEIMMISGNHDSAPRVNVFRSILSRQHLHMIGMPPQTENDFIEKVTLADEHGNVNFYLLPFVKPSMVKQIVGTDDKGNNLSYDASVRALIAREEIDQTERNVFVSHQFYLPSSKKAEDIERMDSEIYTVGGIDQVSADVLKIFDYSALGHIHKPMKVGENAMYCGTPLACSVSEAEQSKHVLMVELKGKGDTVITELPLTPLRQVRVIRDTLEEVLKKACDDYVKVILTDPTEVDVFDMQDRVRYAFPRLLEVGRDYVRTSDYSRSYTEEEVLDTFQLCCTFLRDLDDEEKEILRDVINTVKEANGE